MEKPTKLSHVYPTSQLLFFDRAVHVMFHFFIPHPPFDPQQQAGFLWEPLTQDTGNLLGPSPGCILLEVSTL